MKCRLKCGMSSQYGFEYRFEIPNCWIVAQKTLETQIRPNEWSQRSILIWRNVPDWWPWNVCVWTSKKRACGFFFVVVVEKLYCLQNWEKHYIKFNLSIALQYYLVHVFEESNCFKLGSKKNFKSLPLFWFRTVDYTKSVICCQS